MDELLLTSQTINKLVKPTERIVFAHFTMAQKANEKGHKAAQQLRVVMPGHRGTGAMCCVPWATCPGLEATSRGCGVPGLGECQPCQHIPISRGRGAAGGARSVPGCSGGWKGPRGCCSHHAASSARERSYSQSRVRSYFWERLH